MKKRMMITAGMMILVFLCSQASAGSSSRRRLEGFLIGSGVTILGAAMFGLLKNDAPPDKDEYRQNPGRHHGEKRFANERLSSFYTPPRPVHRNRPEPVYAGYYTAPPVNDHRRQKKRIWVDPVYEEIAVPGYYNKRQQWVEGYHEKIIVKQGYWKK